MSKANSILIVLLIPIILLFSVFCSNSEKTNDTGPVISLLNPASKAINMPGFKLIVRGENFTEFSKIYFGDQIMETSFISENELQCDIGGALIAANSVSHIDLSRSEESESEIPVKISNGGGNFSNERFFSVKENNLFKNPVELTEGSTTLLDPEIAVDSKGVIYIVYERFEQNIPGGYISVIKSEDGGDDWSEPIDLFYSEERSYNASITTASDGSLYVVFYCIRVMFTSSIDSGETWSVPVPVGFDTPTPVESVITIDSGGGIHLIWLIKSWSADTSIYYQSSDDGGVSFTTARNISSESKNFSSVYNPSFGSNDGGLYAAWSVWPSGGSRYSYIYFNYSNDLGETWNSKDRYFAVASDPSIDAGAGYGPYMAISDSYLPFQNNIVLYQSSDSGETWQSGINVTSDSNDTFPVVRSDSAGNINILFKRGSEYMYTRSIDTGVTWSDPIYVTDKLSSYNYRSRLIDMAVDHEGTMYVISEYGEVGRIYFTKSY